MTWRPRNAIAGAGVNVLDTRCSNATAAARPEPFVFAERFWKSGKGRRIPRLFRIQDYCRLEKLVTLKPN